MTRYIRYAFGAVGAGVGSGALWSSYGWFTDGGVAMALVMAGYGAGALILAAGAILWKGKV